MLSESAIAVLAEAKIQLAGSVVSIPNVENGYFIPILVKVTSSGNRPSKITLLEVQQRLRELNIYPQFIQHNEIREEAEAFLRSSLLTSFSDELRNVFLTIRPTSSEVWLDTVRALTPKERSGIEEHVKKFAELSKLPAIGIAFKDDVSLPTKSEILSSIRLYAPIDSPSLRDELARRVKIEPPADWLNRQLDSLRKGGSVIRRSDGAYCLTNDALKRLGTRKDRRSPDVSRLLALARSGR